MEGQFVVTEFDRLNRRTYELTGDSAGTVTWSIAVSEKGADVVYYQETQPPGPDLLDTVTELITRTFLQRDPDTIFLQRDAETMMEKVRTLEADGGTDAA